MARNQPTFSEVRTEVRRLLNDLNGGIWSDSEVNRNINRAILRVWIDTEWERKTSTFEGVEGDSWYLWPADWLLAREIIATDWSQEKIFATDFTPLDKFDAGWENELASIPSRFMLFSYDRIYIWPPVSLNSGQGTFTVQYVPVPETVTSDASTTLGSESTVPPLYIADLIPLKAAALCWLRENWQEAQRLEAIYKSALSNAQVTLRNTSFLHTTKLRPASKYDKAHGAMKFKLRL